MSRYLPVVTIALLAAACSSSPSPTEDAKVGHARSAVIGGKNSDTSQDAVVLLVHYDPSKAGAVGSCTGSLIAPNLVLTARHCVADTDEAAACAADGTPIAEGVVRANHKPSTLYVFKGKNRPNFYGGDIHWDGQGAQILDDGGTNLCSHDIALVLLQNPVADAQIIPLRLDGDVQKGESFTAVGWGVTDTSIEPDVRQQRANVKVESIGPDDNAMPPVPPNEFQVGESICSGDSGGPAISTQTGAVIGIVSRGGNAQQPNQQDPSANCIGAENLYTRLAPFKDLIMKGFELAEADPWVEGGPDPRLLKPGSACEDSSECRSDLCMSDPTQKGQTTCADDCSEADCPDGYVCHKEGDMQVCRDAEALKNSATVNSQASGCATAPGSSPSGALALVMAAFGFAALRRRRS
jgi:MYXO-CTERM domain-containing protein